ncbi:hypothetical protein RFI_06212 [Reticulomyxa filosa]|uniref:Uncharacterized protein n=1 Tax=Reticulomyxa filosa TaxID=46433 RepID=X6NYG6_RETFI|nr:hypothetical protein RFI_06212 [Reticulomyxa filosa]|eukprot:ETO30908.1 hypothetical protein RFI_06212 [Reticulomyxa filosa]
MGWTDSINHLESERPDVAAILFGSFFSWLLLWGFFRRVFRVPVYVTPPSHLAIVHFVASCVFLIEKYFDGAKWGLYILIGYLIIVYVIFAWYLVLPFAMNYSLRFDLPQRKVIKKVSFLGFFFLFFFFIILFSLSNIIVLESYFSLQNRHNAVIALTLFGLLYTFAFILFESVAEIMTEGTMFGKQIISSGLVPRYPNSDFVTVSQFLFFLCNKKKKKRGNERRDSDEKKKVLSSILIRSQKKKCFVDL